MIKNRSSIRTDHSGQEMPEDGLSLFDLTVNDGDIHNYIAGHIPCHWHQELEIYLQMEGPVKITAGDTVCQLQAGEGCFFNTRVIHSFTGDPGKPCKYRSFVFDAGIVSGAPGSIFDTRYVRPLLDEGAPFLRFFPDGPDQTYFEQFQRAFDACVTEQSGYEFQVRDALSNILLYTREKSNVTAIHKIPEIQETRLKQMLTWIDANTQKQVTLTDIARAANVCPRECQRIFRRYLNYSPMEYLMRKRIFAAARQLGATDAPITDIALSCGFSSPSYFSKQFKAILRTTPAEYRLATKKAMPG